MSARNHSIKVAKVGFMLCVAILGTLTGCTGEGDRPRPWYVFMASPKVVIQDAYVYYPDHDVYYDSTSSKYMYVEDSAWVTAPTPPPRVSVEVLRASPSVKLEAKDFPKHHHAVMVVRK